MRPRRQERFTPSATWPRTRSRRRTSQPSSPAYHRVGTRQQYQFLIDYWHLSAAPADNPAEGFVYAPGAPVAIWQ